MAKKATILIVDKEKILVDLLVRALSTPELSVIGTTTADEGGRLIELHGPDLSVIDVSVENGLSLIGSLASDPAKTKIVAVVDSPENRRRVEALRIETVVERSSGWEVLIAAIRAALPASLRISGPAERASILICDDEDDIRVVLSEYLKGHGFGVLLAKHGREALEVLQKNPSTQILLLDLSMPIMGGMDVLNQIMKYTPHPSVIMITAIADREIARQAMKMGAFDYILKPFDFAAIENSIEACLSYSEYQKQPWWKRLTRS
jgi:DNA-binding NtrC family response regulator